MHLEEVFLVHLLILIDEHVTVSSRIVTNNYYEYLEEKLEEYKEKVSELEETTCPIESE